MPSRIEWPHRTLWRVEDAPSPRELAALVVAAVGDSPYEWLKPGRFQITAADYHGSSLQALCLPMNGDRFRFAISDAWPEQSEEHAFLVCHEAAHTFFYVRAPGTMPRRATPVGGADESEERYCDSFAKAVLGISTVPKSLKTKERVA